MGRWVVGHNCLPASGTNLCLVRPTECVIREACSQHDKIVEIDGS